LRLFLLPGDLVCDWAGLPKDSDHRQILRMFLNTIVWGGLGSWAAIAMSL
jgi:hypothetical protein